MSSIKPLIAGNWKMNKTRDDAVSFVEQLAQSASDLANSTQVLIFPAFVHLDACLSALDAGHIGIGAQNCSHEPDGAFTGEISIAMLKDLGISHVLIGHSERRHVMGETLDLIKEKTHAALQAGLHTVLCIGETIEQREAGDTDAVNDAQLTTALDGLPTDLMANLTVAYEPVWAIGTGKTATPDDAQQAHAFIRERLAELSDDATAQNTRILYGGSVKPGNAPELFGMPDVDGGLVGGASLELESFMGIIRAGAKTDALPS